jgi:hypothetical protein
MDGECPAVIDCIALLVLVIIGVGDPIESGCCFLAGRGLERSAQ